MVEENKRRRKHRRLSFFTDCIILVVLLLVFWGFSGILKTDSPTKENESINYDQLALEGIETKDKNEIITEKILDEFGVKIKYGNDSIEDVERVAATIQLNEDIVYKNLLNVYNTFSQYPREYFKYSNLTVVILDKFSNNNIALASRNNRNEFKIYISNAEEYERALNHEMYHVFEYMLSDSQREEIALEWQKLNPEDFVYNSNVYQLTDKYVYCAGCNLSDTYFVTKYSKASNKEDRAEIFAEIMTYDVKEQLYFCGEINPLIEKAGYIIDLLNAKYDIKNGYKWNILD